MWRFPLALETTDMRLDMGMSAVNSSAAAEALAQRHFYGCISIEMFLLRFSITVFLKEHFRGLAPLKLG
jgi:hypothetical protein